jgi:hypothetical protein
MLLRGFWPEARGVDDFAGIVDRNRPREELACGVESMVAGKMGFLWIITHRQNSLRKLHLTNWSVLFLAVILKGEHFRGKKRGLGKKMLLELLEDCLQAVSNKTVKFQSFESGIVFEKIQFPTKPKLLSSTYVYFMQCNQGSIALISVIARYRGKKASLYVHDG